MANYCSNCGNSVESSATYCSNCGTALNGGPSISNSTGNNSGSATSAAGTILGTLVTVSLLGGLTRQLYYYNGRYFLDPYCRNPFVGPRILGHRRHMMGMHRGPMHPRGGFGGPHGGGGHHGGGGPRGGHR